MTRDAYFVLNSKLEKLKFRITGNNDRLVGYDLVLISLGGKELHRQSLGQASGKDYPRILLAWPPGCVLVKELDGTLTAYCVR